MDAKSTNTDDSRMILFRMTSLEAALRELTSQVSRLVVIEERQSQTSASVERAFSEIKSQDVRIKALELAQPITNRTNVWVERAVIAVVSSAAAGAFLLR